MTSATLNPAPPEFTEHSYASTDGLRLYYRCFPGPAAAKDPRVVLCLPGLTRNSRDFESLATHLDNRYRVLTPDLRGRGRSAHDPDWRNYNPARYVEDAWRLLEVEHVARCAIVGTSLGGLMGIIMAALEPQRIGALVLNDIGPVLDPRGLERIRAHAGKQPPMPDWQAAAAQARLVHGHAFPDLTAEEWLAFARRIYRETPDGSIRPDLDPNIARAFGDPATAAPDLWPYFRRLSDVALLVLRGANSDLFSAETLAQMQQVKPDLRSVVVPNRGHTPSLSEPQARQAIDEFLAATW